MLFKILNCNTINIRQTNHPV